MPDGLGIEDVLSEEEVAAWNLNAERLRRETAPKKRGVWKRGWQVDGVFYEEHQVVCPRCSRPMPMQPGIHGRPYYTCPLDDMSIGCHPDGRPLGLPADGPTRQLRKAAHNVFDRLWKTEGLSRKTAYEWIASVMNIPEADAHIARFNQEQCEVLIEAIQAKLAIRHLEDLAKQEKKSHGR